MTLKKPELAPDPEGLHPEGAGRGLRGFETGTLLIPY